MSAGSSFGGCRGTEISAMVIALSGDPRTWYLPPGELDVLRAASRSAAQMRFALSCTFVAARTIASPPTGDRDP